jgi:SpoVK/Ycf46/Vps4 family AAA+-type ATPase
MARADLLKTLFRSYKAGDDAAFRGAAREIIEDERKKTHVVLANELTRILENGRGLSALHATDLGPAFQPLPRDSDRGAPLLEIRQPQRSMDSLVLTREQTDLLSGVVTEFRQWEVLEAHGLRPSTKLLFCGPPGCGKTATAEAVSCSLGVPLLYVRFDAVVSSLLGETAANLRKVFDYASSDSWVVFFDEFDAIGRSRDDATEHGELKRVVNSFLQLLDGYRGRSLVIAATNFEQSLDPALWRRFDEIIRFERPNQDQIELLLRRLLRSEPRSELQLREVAGRLAGMSHAEIERVCVDALRTRVLAGRRALTREDMDQAVAKQLSRQRALLSSVASVPPPAVDAAVNGPAKRRRTA